MVEDGAFADLLLGDGDPLANLDRVANPAKNLVLIMKDGKFFKYGLSWQAPMDTRDAVPMNQAIRRSECSKSLGRSTAR